MSLWQRAWRAPQRIWLRRALFQIHLWSGIALGLYVVMLSITGSVLVYRNELDRYLATPRPAFVAGKPALPREQLRAAAERFRYRRRVFVAPPWPEIYVNDAERRQDFAEAIRSYDAVVDAYESCGYELVALPKSTVDERVDFVLSRSGRS